MFSREISQRISGQITEAPLEVINKEREPLMRATVGEKACHRPAPVAAEAAVAAGGGENR